MWLTGWTRLAPPSLACSALAPLQVAPPQLSEADQRAAVERFLNERCHFITVAPANCLSLMLANPQDVFEW